MADKVDVDNVVSLAHARERRAAQPVPAAAPPSAPRDEALAALAPVRLSDHAAAMRARALELLEAGRAALVIFNADFPCTVWPACASGAVKHADGPVRMLALRFERWGWYSPQVYADRLEETLGFGGVHARCVVPFAAVFEVKEVA